jgi:hypothetical protein
MPEALGLFEYLGTPVPDSVVRLGRLSTDGSRMTFVDDETYDDANDWLGIPAADAEGLSATRHTESNGETYDDDPGLGSLGVPRRLDGSTMLSRTDGETYDDDPGVTRLSVPLSNDTSRLTKVDAETYDDEPGFNRLCYPQC